MFFKFVTVQSVPAPFIESIMLVFFSLVNHFLRFLIHLHDLLVQIFVKWLQAGCSIIFEFGLGNYQFLFFSVIDEIDFAILVCSFVIILIETNGDSFIKILLYHLDVTRLRNPFNLVGFRIDKFEVFWIRIVA